MSRPIRVVVADDSPFVCRLMTSYLQSTPDFQVVGTALNGERVVELVRELRPDTVTLDLDMPGTDGLEALERIMYECPTPVVLVSGISRKAATTTLKALDIGAIDFILKYTPGVDTDPDVLRHEIIAKVRAAAEIKVIRSIPLKSIEVEDTELSGFLSELPAEEELSPDGADRQKASFDLPGGVIVIGASTGGPIALRMLLSNLPASFPGAVIIVQHMPATFTRVLAAQLNRQVPLRVKEAEPGDRLHEGLALVAPGGNHLLLQPDSHIELSQAPEIRAHRPSIDVTMQSVSQLYGPKTKGVLLTGMGDDGVLGLVSIRAKGGKTFAQDATSCVVNGMPQRAIERGVVDHVASPNEIGQILKNWNEESGEE